MKRWNVREFIDQTWLPQSLRNAVTDSLQFFAHFGDNFRYIAPRLREALLCSDSRRVIDLCSGGSGPWSQLRHRLELKDGAPVEIINTDLYPSEVAKKRIASFQDPHVRYFNGAVDATNVPENLSGFRTLFNGFHHFAPAEAFKILSNCVSARAGIGIFEPTARSWGSIAFMLTAIPLTILLAPFIRPFKWSRVFWTWIVPALPVILAVDGILSCLRSYTETELRLMAEAVGATDYVWEIGRLATPRSPLSVTYLIGYPPLPLSEKTAPDRQAKGLLSDIDSGQPATN